MVFISEKGRLALFLALTFAVCMPTWANDSKKEEKKESVKLEAREIFKKLDVAALEILQPSARMDMLDYWDADSVYKASNAMEGLSWLDYVDENYLKVNVTKVSTFEIKILPYKHEELVMTIYTVGAEAQSSDSQINFYDAELKQLETRKFFDDPELKDFFEIPKGSITTMKEVREMIPFPTVAYTATAESNDLQAILTVKEFLNEDDWNIIKLFLKPSITLEWKKDKYKYQK